MSEVNLSPEIIHVKGVHSRRCKTPGCNGFAGCLDLCAGCRSRIEPRPGYTIESRRHGKLIVHELPETMTLRLATKAYLEAVKQKDREWIALVQTANDGKRSVVSAVQRWAAPPRRPAGNGSSER